MYTAIRGNLPALQISEQNDGAGLGDEGPKTGPATSMYVCTEACLESMTE